MKRALRDGSGGISYQVVQEVLNVLTRKLALQRHGYNTTISLFNRCSAYGVITRAMVMLLEKLHAQREAIYAACRRYGARRIRVFGSVARGEEEPDSDIDFLVDFPPGYDLFTQRLPLAERLAEITGRRLDVIPEHELNRHIRAAVLKEAVDL
ncbi:MAG: nucleotidyltransferase domain-containing protein [Nitrococcus sp.]|nr:nucleotidyltransferase domain-containing protein [Nitrococcus sp.]